MNGFAQEIIKQNKERTNCLAIVDKEGTREITWDILLDNIYRVAAYAKNENIKGTVPVQMDRGMEAVASLLGLNLAGLGVAPVSITTPSSRCKAISEQVKNSLWTADTFDAAIKQDPEYTFNNEANPAYVVFTSGSTGTPKGVVLGNKAILEGIKRAASDECFGLDENSRMLQCSSFSFIAFIADFLAPLYAGIPVWVLPEKARGDIRTITDYVNRFGITNMFLSPQMYRNFEGGPSLKCVCIGGDKISNLGPNGFKLISIYGMTEIAGFAFSYEIKEKMVSTPIGVPCKGLCGYIIDDEGNEASEGELCVSGEIASEYINLPELNAKTFTPNKFSDDPNHRILLHTGDIVKRLPDGNYQYINRKDNMIKINGQRVEPGEIEALLANYPGIDNIAVKGFTDSNQRSILCAYYTSGCSVDENGMKEYLNERLPHYMVPSIFVKMDKIPLNANGKLDRKSLEMPDLSLFLGKYEEPIGEVECALCNAFAKVLGLEKTGRKDDFFKIGGDSIAALSVASECARYGVSTGDIFAGRTPESIANLASNALTKIYSDLPKDTFKAKLTDSQINILLECGMHEKKTVYNIPVHISFPKADYITGEFVKKTVDNVLKMHPALYSNIVQDGSEFFMIRRDFPENGICKLIEKEADEDEIIKYSKSFIKPIALGDDSLCSATVITDSSKVHIFINMHHIVSDGTSVSILCRQIGEALEGIEIKPETTDSFALYEAESRLKSSTRINDAKTYFKNLLEGVEIDSNILADKKPEENEKRESANLYREIDVKKVSDYIKSTGITENTFFMGIFGYLLAKMTAQSESLFAVAENGRNTKSLNDTVSMLVKTLPVVMKIDEEKSPDVLLSSLQNQFFATMRNDCIGFGDLAKDYCVRSDVMFVYQSDMFAGYNGRKISIDIEIPSVDEALANLSMMIIKKNNAYRVKLEYRKDMYEEYTMSRFLDLYEHMVDVFTTNAPLKDACLISCADREFLDSVNSQSGIINAKETILDQFAKTVSKYPHKNAVICRNVSYTYSQVDEITDRIASRIHELGIGRGDVVSVLIPRGEYMMIASIGVLKSGAAYEPLDPAYPAERLTFMVNDAESKLLIKDRALDNILEDYDGIKIFTDEFDSLPAKTTSIEPPQMNDLFVLLYTSGTTGTPKGVMLTHNNLAHFVAAHIKSLGIDNSCIIANYASYGFDAHMADLYPAIVSGSTLVIIPDEMRLDLAEVKKYCESMNVTHLLMTTQVARQFAVQFCNVEHLKCLSTGGEKLASFDPVQNYKVFNLYGPSECTVGMTRMEVDKYYDNIPIGRVTQGTKAYVVDSYGRRTPIGVPGELIICGPQVGAGYLNRPDQTKKVFVENTYEKATPEYKRCYKTGDIVRFINDGNIEFIGRRDHQIKIRGFRVELEEVETAIREYKDINDVVVSVTDKNGVKNICAYITSDKKIDISDLNNFVGSKHPAYMIPTVTMQIESIPLTANGKVDKRKLPDPQIQCISVKKAETELQKSIFNEVAAAIGTDSFGIDTDIFSAGLSSIGCIQLCTLLSENIGIPVKIRDLKKYPTVEKLEEFAISESKKYRKTADISCSDINENDKVEYLESYPITKTMEGIFAECIQRPDSTVYNIPLVLKLGKSVDITRLKKAIATAIEAHNCIKAELFYDKNGKICQHIRKNDIFTEKDIKETLLQSEEEIKSIIKPFKLTDSRLFDIEIVSISKDTYLVINIHHIISDGTSLAILTRDIELAYFGNTVTKESFTSFDIANEEIASRTPEELDSEKKYYSSLLEGLDKDFLPTPDKPSDIAIASGRLTPSQIESDVKSVEEYCKIHKIGVNAFFVSVFGFVLAKYAGSDYSVFNTVYNGRNDSRKMNSIAMLVKTIPVVCNIDTGTVTELTSGISRQLIDSMSNDLYSYAEISRELGTENNVMFVFQGDNFNFDNFCNDKSSEININLSEPKASMTLEVIIKDNKFVYNLEYDPAKFTEKLGIALIQAVDTAASSFINTNSLSEVKILSESAESEMERYNDTMVDYDKNKTIPDHFLSMVKLHPESLCVQYKDKNLTFRQVGELSGKLALLLIKKRIGRGDIVAILINRDENMVITAHGVECSGAAYVGLDPTYPPDRLEFMINDSRARCLIADRSLIDIVKNYKGDVIFTDEIANLPAFDESELIEAMAKDKHKATPEDDALVIYSSGTTGVPKGSVLRHRNIVCFFNNYISDCNIGFGSNVATYASFGFDGGAMDVFSAPMSGASLFVIPDDIRLDLGKLEQFFQENKITNSFMTTQVGCMFIANTNCRSLKHFFVGGEKLIPITAPDWVTFANGYGPSETMCYVNHYKVHDSGNFQPIGKVSGNTKEYVVDKFRNRLPYGACGELCISGGQVGKGYLYRPEKTKEVFVSNPFSKESGYEIMYRTGDIVRMLTDGNYDFVGRRDGQVKIRGFRIEIGEVEQQIRKYPGVKKAVVRAFDSTSGGKYLASYVVYDGKLDIDNLRNFIGKEKPDYMIPAVFIQINDIPLTSNGKTDFSKLPKPDFTATKNGIEPTNQTEEKICKIFGEVLGIGKVYANDDFFKIGGSSISAIQVVVKCEQSGFPVVYKNLFANPTPKQLAEFISGNGKESDVTATELDKNDSHDYSALLYNVPENLPKIRYTETGDVLLTGVTGFLGSHIFHELIESTSGNVICLVRGKKNLDSITRFESIMTYYFDNWYSDKIKTRTVVVDGSLEDENICIKLSSYHFDTIINCAANVKHFAIEDELLKSNFSGVESLIELAQSKGAKLIQISSLSVSGESVNGSVPSGFVFKENNLNIGQSLENKYVYTKYLGEQAVIDAISKKKIKGKIMRLGNLMARIDDREFQINARSNGFLRMFIGFKKLGCFPVDMLDAEVEFSPIDNVAKAIVLLTGTPDEFTVFHAKNCNTIHYSYMLKAVTDAGYNIEVVENEIFEQRLQNALKDSKETEDLGGLLAYRNSINSTTIDVTKRLSSNKAETISRIQIPSSTTFTAKALYRLGFGWQLIGMDYLRDMVNGLVELDFFD